MKKNIKKITLVIIILGILLVGYNIINKIIFNSYLNDSIKYLEKMNYDSNIVLSIKDKQENSSIEYNVKYTSNITKEDYSQKVNEKTINKITNYYEKNKNDLILYSKTTGDFEKSNVEKIKTLFKVKYDYLKKSSKLKYKGIEKIDSKKYKVYEVSMNSYDIYNMIYDDDILTKKDINTKSKVKIYVDKDERLISSIISNIDNLNNSKYDEAKLYYSLTITNSNFNNVDKIEIPNN